MDQKPTRTLTEREFNAITKRVLDSAPAGMSEADYERWIRPAMESAIAEAEGRPEPVNMHSSLRRTVTNAADVLNPLNVVEGVFDAVASPIETGKAIWGAMGEQAGKARTAWEEGRYSEALGHGMASAIPIIGPAAAGAGEQIGEGDVAGGLGRGAALAAVSSPSAMRSAVSGARQAIPANIRDHAASALTRGAEARLTDVMVPKAGPNKTRFGENAAEIAPELLKRGNTGAWSREGLHRRVQDGFQQAQAALDAAADARLSARSFNTQPIVDALRAQRRRWVAESSDATQSQRQPTIRISKILDEKGNPIEVPGFEPKPYGKDVVPEPRAPRVEMLDKMIAEIEALGPTARYDALKTIRQAYDLEAKAAYNQVVGADYLKKREGSFGAADGTSVLREHLAKFDPRTAAANAEYSLFKTADDVLQAAAEMERVQPKVGRRIMARLTGTFGGSQAAGVPGAVAGFVLGPVVETAAGSGLTTKLKTAQAMSALAKAIRKGDEGRVASLVQTLKQLGVRATAVQATSPSGSQIPATAPAR